MQTSENVLRLPQDALRLEEIENQLKRLRRELAEAAVITAAIFWALIFGILVWTVVEFDYSWSPMAWLAPTGAAIASSGAVLAARRRKLRAEKRRLDKRAGRFIIHDTELDTLKHELCALMNEALSYCTTDQEKHQVLSAYYTAAQELISLDAAADTAENRLGYYRELYASLRTVRDRIDGERELM